MFSKDRPLKLLIIGASGVFGSRLAERVALEHGVAITLAARNLAKLHEVAARLPCKVACIAMDRDTTTAVELHGYHLVIDAAGPFDRLHNQVIVSAIAAGVDYIDLADGREFVRNFANLNDVAIGAQVALTSGASSIPALSHAVIDDLTEGWQQIDQLRVGIFPGNRAPRGLCVVQSILSYVGRPVRVFRDGEWSNVEGWGLAHREDIAGLGKRWASVCETPEQDLLVERYKPSTSAEFFAGLELSIMHLGLLALSMPVRWKWLKSLRSFAKPMLKMAQWFLPFGSDRGAMKVFASGTGPMGIPIERTWTLRADANRGPYVPVLAALAMIRKYRDGNPPQPGARACSGILSLADFSADFADLGITHRLESASGEIAIGFDSHADACQSLAA